MKPNVMMCDGLEAATLTASGGSATGYPLTHLQDRRYATQWKSGATTANQTLEVQVPNPGLVDSLLIANHNLTATGISSLRLDWYDGDNWNVSNTLTDFPDPLFVTEVHGGDKHRLVFVKTSALSAAPQLGMLMLGKRVELPLHSNSPERGPEADVEVDESISGLRFGSSVRAHRERFNLSLNVLKTLDHAEFCRLHKTVNGREKPFWWRDMDLNWHFVRLDRNHLPSVSRGNLFFAVRQLEMSEERVGTTLNLPGGYSV